MSDSIKLTISGDLFPTPINYQLFSDGKAEIIFGEEVCNIFKSSDYSICNLEGCFTDENTPPKLKDGPTIRAPKDCVAAIVDLGVNCVSLANNHATDYGAIGLKDTYGVLEKSKISFFGAGLNEESISTHHTILVKGKRITFYGVSETIENVPSKNSPGVNIYDEYRVCNELKSLKDNCDFLIVLYHGGIENIHYNTPSIRTRFHRMADNGADIIISQHTHAIGEEEYYHGSYLLYGQGNFCFHFSKSSQEWVMTGLLLEVELNDNGFDVKKHIVRRNGASIVYDNEQDFTEFYDRSKRLSKNDDFSPALSMLAEKNIVIYLQAFRGKNVFDRIARKILPKEKYVAYLKRHYTKKQILRILLALQCEEFREVSSRGLLNMLDDILQKENMNG